MRPHAKRVLVALATASMIAIGDGAIALSPGVLLVVCLAARTNAAAADMELVDR